MTSSSRGHRLYRGKSENANATVIGKHPSPIRNSPKTGPRSQVIAFEEELDVWAEAAPTGVFKTITELKAKVARLEEELRTLNTT